jgi:uncharacterized protein YjgD (DUF1641 family)
MAKAIRQIKKEVPNPVEEKAEAITAIVDALAENRDAIVKTLNIVKQLNEFGILDAANALLEKRTEVSVIALQQVNQPAMYNAVKNAFNAFKFFSSLQPDKLQTIMSGVDRGLERFTDAVESGEEQSLWKLGRSMTNPEIRTSLTSMLQFLRGMGEAFSEDQQQLQ